MIFSIVARTECIVFPTFNTKVASAFEEVKEVSNVTMAKTMAEFRNALKSRGKKQVQYHNDYVKDNYKKVLNEIIGKDVVYLDVHMNSEESEIFEVAGYWSAQHYETEYWQRTIKKEYEKLEISNRERINEISAYKDWVSNLETQLEQAKTNYQKVQAERSKETGDYKN